MTLISITLPFALHLLDCCELASTKEPCSYFTEHSPESLVVSSYLSLKSLTPKIWPQYRLVGQKVFRTTSHKKNSWKFKFQVSSLSTHSPTHTHTKVTNSGFCHRFQLMGLTDSTSLKLLSSWHHSQQPPFFLLYTSALSLWFKLPLSYFQQRMKIWFIILPLMTTEILNSSGPKEHFPQGII